MQAELSKGGDSLLSKVMAAFARPTRLVSSQAVSPDAQVDAQLFEADEERQLQAAYHEVASKVDFEMAHVCQSLAATVQHSGLAKGTWEGC